MEVLNKLDGLKFNIISATKEFIAEFDKVIGRFKIEKFAYQTTLLDKVPYKIVENLSETTPEWRELDIPDLKKLIAIDWNFRQVDPVLQQHDGGKKADETDPDKMAHRDRRMADENTRLTRKLEEKTHEAEGYLEAQKKWANSEVAKKKNRPNGTSVSTPSATGNESSQWLCWNCWEPDHNAGDCLPHCTWEERESLRQQKGVPASQAYEDALNNYKNRTAATTAPVTLLTCPEPPQTTSDDDDIAGLDGIVMFGVTTGGKSKYVGKRGKNQYPPRQLISSPSYADDGR
jgi:hypothetical protein